MDELAFTSSAPLSLGVELELQLVRPHDLDLARDADELLRRLAKRKLPGAVKPEITESMIELNSAVHRDCGSLLDVMEHRKPRHLSLAAGRWPLVRDCFPLDAYIDAPYTGLRFDPCTG